MKDIHVAFYPDLSKSGDLWKFIENLLEYQLNNDIPIITLNLLDIQAPPPQWLSIQLQAIFDTFQHHQIIHDNQIKVSVLGKWYELDELTVQPIKESIAQTKDYDAYFLNLCIYYDGQDEIAEACKLITRRALTGKISPEQITPEVIKENLDSSFFVPPNKIILLDNLHSAGNFLLWDSGHAQIIKQTTPWTQWENLNTH